MEKFLDTKDKMNIVESDEFTIVNWDLKNEWLDLTMSKFYDKVDEMIELINLDSPVVYNIHFDGIAEDLEMMIDGIIETIISALTMNGHDKFKEEIWQPRSEVSERLAANMISQKRLIQKSSFTKVFNIKIYIEDQEVYSLIVED